VAKLSKSAVASVGFTDIDDAVVVVEKAEDFIGWPTG
jgi:hypothetical protein